MSSTSYSLYATLAMFPSPTALRFEGNGTVSPTLQIAGQYIGWFERALLFGLVVGGQPEAAVLVIAAKSLARPPELMARIKGFAEYSLIGTLASLAIALAAAVTTRVLLGWSPF
ncbi:MAG: hypothetical protein GEV11_15815 [Streptosporangiales bacterium]|nr:hypothetical protein [Streptosporangiales bacterium]